MHSSPNVIQSSWKILWSNWWGSRHTHPGGVSQTPVACCCLHVEASGRHTMKWLKNILKAVCPRMQKLHSTHLKEKRSENQEHRRAQMEWPVGEGVILSGGEFRMLKTGPKWFRIAGKNKEAPSGSQDLSEWRLLSTEESVTKDRTKMDFFS